MRRSIAGFFLLLSLLSCGDNRPGIFGDTGQNYHAEPVAMMTGDALQTRTLSPGAASEAVLKPDSRIIKTGNIALEVEKLENAKQFIDSMLITFGGYYASENYNDFDHESVFNLTVRIPAISFELFIEGVESSGGRVVQKNIFARDVTEEFMDIEMRLNNRRSYLKRYNDLLLQARSVADILEIQEKTRRLEEEIESVEGRLKYLGNQVEFSTLDLTISQKKEFRFQPVKRDRFLERLKKSLSGGWFGLLAFILLIIRLWPLWIIVSLLVLVWRIFRIRKDKTRIKD